MTRANLSGIPRVLATYPEWRAPSRRWIPDVGKGFVMRLEASEVQLSDVSSEGCA